MINIDDLRAVVRPYVARNIQLSEMLEKLWPLCREMGSSELTESIHDLLALHASRAIDEIALRQRIQELVFAPATIANAVISDLRSELSPEPKGKVMSVTTAWGSTQTCDSGQLQPA